MNVLQIILITLLAALKKIDQKGPQVFIYNTVFWGALAGLIMGDVTTRLTIGATFQLMSIVHLYQIIRLVQLSRLQLLLVQEKV